MSAGMNLEEAKIVADKMTYADAVCNAVNSKCVPYRKATGIKLKELLKIAKSVDEAKSKGCNEISTALYYDGFNDGYSKALEINIKISSFINVLNYSVFNGQCFCIQTS